VEAFVPKLPCPCGYIHNLSPIPDAGWRTIPDRRYEEFVAATVALEQIGAGGPPPPDHPRRAEFRAARQVVVSCLGLLYCCSECGRILWKREGSEYWEVFAPETKADEPDATRASRGG
jgi:hypothetical protein